MDRRTALITDPPDGRIPYTPEMAERSRLQGIYRVSGERNSWVDVDTGERCMTDGVPMFWLGYNPNHQIVQTPDHVVILHEMFRDRRIIPLGDGLQGSIRQWNGDIRGHWDGDTLVVESTRFVGRTDDRWAQTWRMPTETMHLVERFTRVDESTLMYEFTLTDPAKFTGPWSVRLPLTTNQRRAGSPRGRCTSTPATRATTASRTCSAAPAPRSEPPRRVAAGSSSRPAGDGSLRRREAMRVLDVMGKPIHVRQNGSQVRVWVGRGARPGYQDHTPFEVGMKVSALRSGAKRARRIPGNKWISSSWPGACRGTRICA